MPGHPCRKDKEATLKANERDIQRVINLARGYDHNLCGKDFLIYYGSGDDARMLEVTFSKKRFNHLVGIDINRCNVKPWVLYKKALAGTLTPHDLGSSLSQYFPSKISAARMMNAFISTATNVSEVNPLSTRVNADIWVSGDTAQFAIGCLKVDAQYHSSSCFVPSSLQLLKPAEVEKKSCGKRLPITAMLSKDASAKSYDTLLYADRDLLEQSPANLGFIIRSFGNTDELKKAYPSIMDEVLGLSPNEGMSIDELAEDKTALAKELNKLNRQRDQFKGAPPSPAAGKSR